MVQSALRMYSDRSHTSHPPLASLACSSASIPGAKGNIRSMLWPTRRMGQLDCSSDVIVCVQHREKLRCQRLCAELHLLVEAWPGTKCARGLTYLPPISHKVYLPFSIVLTLPPLHLESYSDRSTNIFASPYVRLRLHSELRLTGQSWLQRISRFCSMPQRASDRLAAI